MENGNTEGLLRGRAPGHLSDKALLARLQELVNCDRQVTAELVAHLAEVAARRLYLDKACSSLFGYATQRLGMSEPAAYKRITVARLARRLPVVLGRLAAGRLHPSGLTALAPHLTEENADELLEAACDRTLREVEKLLALRFPKAPVPDSVRRLPWPRERTEKPLPEPRRTAAAAEPYRTESAARAIQREGAESAALAIQREGVESAALAIQREGAEHPLLPRVASVAARRDARAECEPLGADRYKIAFTASAALKQKLDAARALVSHSLPDASLAEIVERALDVLIERERARRFAVRGRHKPKQPEPSQGEAASSGQPRTQTRRAESSSPETSGPRRQAGPVQLASALRGAGAVS